MRFGEARGVSLYYLLTIFAKYEKWIRPQGVRFIREKKGSRIVCCSVIKLD